MDELSTEFVTNVLHSVKLSEIKMYWNLIKINKLSELNMILL